MNQNNDLSIPVSKLAAKLKAEVDQVEAKFVSCQSLVVSCN